ncbi:unnamed protein product [Pieris macdunnoughi]|uniref:Uncharacterized protein n=1 Tax=Pieris macdunnoughi TaxID=345717 RepID=A0A821VA27_9NEOP|nr:unnamed protein product [Pieris macdunnoughi]
MEVMLALLLLQFPLTTCSPLRSNRPVIRLEAYKTTLEKGPCRDGRCLKLNKVLQSEDTTTSTAPPTVGTRRLTTTPIDMERCANVAKCNVNIWYD